METTPWPTPTPYVFGEATPVLEFFDNTELRYEMAEDIVQGYGFINRDGMLELFWFFIIFIMVIAGIWTLIRHARIIAEQW